ncbi:hypothetical protein [Bowmanella dokdonensis]|uniref:Uncharacterized protein n=1 Tax=Bowmanella dokdonensis TaxID=751969 RepID=A0A939DQ94_9ALTE|nr:hypothetical protein [Bowmanella dokdonensis]MBN7826805.1 hypothetical protein [Bowmanella dokdonensis]
MRPLLAFPVLVSGTSQSLYKGMNIFGGWTQVFADTARKLASNLEGAMP